MNLRPCCLLVAILLISTGLVQAQEGKGERLLFVGNSITLHGPSAKIGWTGDWGMAASAAEKDYVHVVVEAVAKRCGKEPEFQVANVAEFERNFASCDVAALLKAEVAFQADMAIVAIGENVPALKTEEAKVQCKASVVKLLALLRREGKWALYVRSCFWADAAKDAVLKEACVAVGGTFVDISTLVKDEANYARAERKIWHAGVGRHPGDQGMRVIAEAIFAAMAKAWK